MMTFAQAFYAACIPPEERDNLEDFRPEDFVSEEKEKIVSIARKIKGTRFKVFTSLEDALEYVEKGTSTIDALSLSLSGLDLNSSESTNGESSPKLPTSTSSNSNTPSELPLPFPSIPVQKLSVFRRIIESDNVDSVQELIWSNPRYLINYTNDIPTIIMIGPRYNSVHIAVRSGSAKALKYILQTLDSVEFMALAYPTANKNELEEKRERLLDLHLNTPDKVNNNSPLHFACSNGHIDCVKILLEYVPKCDFEYRNKHGQTCKEVIKKDDNAATIAALFDDCMYVAVVRSHDELEYQLPLPCFGKKNLQDSFDSKKFHVSALAGPMSPQRATTLYQTITSPKHSTPEHRDLRLRDPVRGLEKVIEKLTFEMDVNFSEDT